MLPIFFILRCRVDISWEILVLRNEISRIIPLNIVFIYLQNLFLILIFLLFFLSVRVSAYFVILHPAVGVKAKGSVCLPFQFTVYAITKYYY